MYDSLVQRALFMFDSLVPFTASKAQTQVFHCESSCVTQPYLCGAFSYRRNLFMLGFFRGGLGSDHDCFIVRALVLKNTICMRHLKNTICMRHLRAKEPYFCWDSFAQCGSLCSD